MNFVLTVAQDVNPELMTTNIGNIASDPIPIASLLAGGPLSDMWFVDAASVAVTPDGTVAFPFPTIAAALAAATAQAKANLTLQIAPGAYGATVINSQTGGFDQLVLFTPDFANGNTNVNSVTIASLGWTPKNAAGSQLVLQGVTVTGALSVTDAASAFGQVVLLDAKTGGFASSNNNTGLRAIDAELVNVIAQSVELRHTTCQDLSVTAGAQAWDSNFNPLSIVGNTSFFNCTLSTPGVGVTFAGGAQVNQWQGCQIAGGAIAFTMTAPGTIAVDGSTNFAFVGSGSTLAGGTLTLTERAARETLSVVVPAVLAGQVGYVSTVLAGQLTGIAQFSPIVGNPQVDLVAAGAGGGFANCWVDVAGSVRCSFLGPLAGGAANFTFAAL